MQLCKTNNRLQPLLQFFSKLYFSAFLDFIITFSWKVLYVLLWFFAWVLRTSRPRSVRLLFWKFWLFFKILQFFYPKNTNFTKFSTTPYSRSYNFFSNQYFQKSLLTLLEEYMKVLCAKFQDSGSNSFLVNVMINFDQKIQDGRQKNKMADEKKFFFFKSYFF